ncbi:hypothetical protein [Bradyrhizobium japonicum]|uniref:Uncharacterized protein n=1 Tax=Bradyrhizobium japonicum TaxID=375 RepID=A0ABV2RLZ8_BRAJP|nr:hypothetical protein [Bradyrhizobium japonicum]MCP1762689.1 hypothetical protein [Bradyrhizobium japonicum]MCP1784821.1 hypothetical protein [Bradyrhizobium japonicum]MCP1806703.1 hypothetical protein [Bradyrhizobium japonicum]MCP1815628.1 hypothetical protein [Bradyrhizobium japonicum]MCP1872855.1 hypothetical protein [Bradyrhizobium japonicum]
MTFTTGARSRIWARIVSALVLAGAFNATGASGATPAKVSGSTALALAGVIAPLSPDLTGAEKKAVAMLFAANAEIPYKKPIVVTVDKIICRTGNVDITLRNCELTFGKKSRTVNGSTANEIFATEALAGIPSDGAAGSNFESLSQLSCTIDPNAIRRKDGSGADCTFQPGN